MSIIEKILAFEKAETKLEEKLKVLREQRRDWLDKMNLGDLIDGLRG